MSELAVGRRVVVTCSHGNVLDAKIERLRTAEDLPEDIRDYGVSRVARLTFKAASGEELRTILEVRGVWYTLGGDPLELLPYLVH
jgi:hypothetical protein